MGHQVVLDKLLANKKKDSALVSSKVSPEELVEKLFKPANLKAVGRPPVETKKKARNFTICMAQGYIQFLDGFKPPIKKIQGRGRKLRFIIDEFIKMSKRQRGQLKFLQESLENLDTILKSFSGSVKKGEKLALTPKEKSLIDTHVSRVNLLAKILCFTPKELQKILPAHHWSLYSFCLNWKR